MICNVCPRKCNIERKNHAGFCLQSEKIRISKVMFHHYEEPIVSGSETSKGSGAIFFSGCNLKCVFCQNYLISHRNKGKDITIKKLAKIFKKLEKKGALNINLVTPSHFSLQIIEALKIYKPKIPIVWNSNGYETEETIEKLKGFVDVFLVDFKYASNELSKKYSNAKDYAEFATRAILKMRELQPKDVIENGLIKKGMIIRHLILPTHSSDSLNCLNFISNNLGNNTIVSIMSQYYPCFKASEFKEINRTITALEYKRVVAHAERLGMDNCFIQQLTSASKEFTPKF